MGSSTLNKLIVFLCFGFVGCASMESSPLYHKYSVILENAEDAYQVKTVLKDETFKVIKEQLSEILTSYGYTNVVFEDPKKNFIVFAKEDSDYPAEIILKYSSDEQFEEIDLVKGSDDPNTNHAVNEDIQEIAADLNRK